MRKGTVEEVPTVFQGNYLQACYQTDSSTPGKGPTAQRETKQAHPIETSDKFYEKSKNFEQQLDHLQENGYTKQQHFKPVYHMKQCDAFFTHRDIVITTHARRDFFQRRT